VKVKRIYSIRRLRLIVNYLIKDDEYFLSLLDDKKDRFFYLFDKAIYGGGAKFYVFYVNDLPVSCVGLNRKTKTVRFFFIDKSYRRRMTIEFILNFIHRKIGFYFYMGTIIDNKRFIYFCKKNNWDVYYKDDNDIIFKICQQEGY